MLQSEHFFTEFLCKEVLVTFQTIAILRTSPDSMDWGWEQQMFKVVDTVYRQWHNRQTKKGMSKISLKILFRGKWAIYCRMVQIY